MLNPAGQWPAEKHAEGGAEGSPTPSSRMGTPPGQDLPFSLLPNSLLLPSAPPLFSHHPLGFSLVSFLFLPLPVVSFLPLFFFLCPPSSVTVRRILYANVRATVPISALSHPDFGTLDKAHFTDDTASMSCDPLVPLPAFLLPQALLTACLFLQASAPASLRASLGLGFAPEGLSGCSTLSHTYKDRARCLEHFLGSTHEP